MNKTIQIYQPNGISCGPTCIKMVYNYVKNNEQIAIDDISNICGTNNIKGTTLDDMIKGLDHFNIQHTVPTNLTDDKKAICFLNTALINDQIVILRTLTHGIKHWIIVDSIREQLYYVNDPWLGELIYTKEQILNIWTPRNFDCIAIIK